MKILKFNNLKNKRYRFKFLIEFYVNWSKLLEKIDINKIILLIMKGRTAQNSRIRILLKFFFSMAENQFKSLRY